MAGSDLNATERSTAGDTSQSGGGMVDRVKERATAQLTNQKDRATDGLGSVAHFVRQGTQQLRDQQHDTLAGYVERAADQIDRLSQQLRDKDVNELFEDAQRMARRRPAMFIGSAFALGVIGARFFKSSSRDDRYDQRDTMSSYGGGVYGGRRSAASGRQSAAEYAAGGLGYGSADYSSESNVGTSADSDLRGSSVSRNSPGTSGATGTADPDRSSARTRSRRSAPGTERS
jgi:hypothetical protein